MRNLFVVLFFGTLLLGESNLFGQEEYALCDCNKINLASINFYRYGNCFRIAISIDESCANANIVKIKMLISDFWECFRRNLQVTNLTTGFTGNFDISNQTQLVLTNNSPNVPSNLNWQICPTGGSQFNCPLINRTEQVDFQIELSDGRICNINQRYVYIYNTDVENPKTNYNTIEVFPNPVNDELRINGIDNIDYDEIKIINFEGIQIFRTNSIQKMDFNTVNLNTGFYSLQLFKSGVFLVAKEFIKND